MQILNISDLVLASEYSGLICGCVISFFFFFLSFDTKDNIKSPAQFGVCVKLSVSLLVSLEHINRPLTCEYYETFLYLPCHHCKTNLQNKYAQMNFLNCTPAGLPVRLPYSFASCQGGEFHPCHHALQEEIGPSSDQTCESFISPKKQS